MPFYSELRKARPAGSADEVLRLRTIKGIKALRLALKAHFPEESDHARTVRIATWNIREFGGTKSGGRKEYEPLYYIAEIISQFDIVAVQEVRGDLDEFGRLCRILGPDWDHLATDVTDGHAGNGERMVFLFNRRRARFRNIAGELTLPDGKKVLASFGERLRLDAGARLNLAAGVDLSGEYPAKTKKSGERVSLDADLEIPLEAGATLTLPEGCALTIVKNTTIERPRAGVAAVEVPVGAVAGDPFRLRLPAGSLDDSFKQFARTPYLVAFQAGWLKINLCTVHIYFGDNEDPKLMEQRRAEIAALTDSLGARAREEVEEDPEARTITAVLGDFNIMSHEHETMQALESSGFSVPDELKQIPGSNVEKDKAYDQIAFWEPKRDRSFVKVEVKGAGVFDFYEHVYRMDEAATYLPAGTPARFKEWRTYKMSDHLPMWVELTSDFSDDYLALCEAAQPEG